MRRVAGCVLCCWPATPTARPPARPSARQPLPLAIVKRHCPSLTSRYGAGPVSAAQVIVSFSHPGRCGSEAAFAALGGTSPIPASSGQTIRHRLNRGGDRAIHAIALTRTRAGPVPEKQEKSRRRDSWKV
jgi:transposase